MTSFPVTAADFPKLRTTHGSQNLSWLGLGIGVGVRAMIGVRVRVRVRVY
jgi:hypothetical protein